LEISFFIHATEDENKIVRSVKDHLHISQNPIREELEGHFGNKIVHLQYHLTQEDAWTTFARVAASLDSKIVENLLANLDAFLDEHKALYIRLSKQELVKGRVTLSVSDPIRVKVKPRTYGVGEMRNFYKRLFELQNN
jgi:RNA binding exosome subunit